MEKGGTIDMANKPKTLDNSTCKAFLQDYLTFSDVCSSHPGVEDLLTGSLQLASPGSTSTRPLRRSVVFHVLKSCQILSVSATDRTTSGRYSRQQAEAYTSLARVVSRAVSAYLERLAQQPRQVTQSMHQAQTEADAPHLATLSDTLEQLENTPPSNPTQVRAEWWLPVGMTLAQSVDQTALHRKTRERMPRLFADTTLDEVR